MKRSAWSAPTSTGYRRNHSLSIGCFFLCSGALHLSGIVDTMEVMNDRGGMTAAAAVRQIVEKDYDAMLISNGIDRSRIRHYSFAFRGKEVLIVGE